MIEVKDEHITHLYITMQIKVSEPANMFDTLGIINKKKAKVPNEF